MRGGHSPGRAVRHGLRGVRDEARRGLRDNWSGSNRRRPGRPWAPWGSGCGPGWGSPPRYGGRRSWAPPPPPPGGPWPGRRDSPQRKVGAAACHRRASGPGLESGPPRRSALERPPAHPAATAPRPSPVGRHDRPRPAGGPLRGGLADRSDRRLAPLGGGRGGRRSDAPGRRPGRHRANGLELEPALLAGVAGRGAHRPTHRHVERRSGWVGPSAASRSATSRSPPQPAPPCTAASEISP